MMHRVHWFELAIEQLEDLCNQANARMLEQILDAVDDVNRRLARDPHNEGESRAYGIRITFVWPLAVFFRVEPDGQNVTVLRVQLLNRRKP